MRRRRHLGAYHRAGGHLYPATYGDSYRCRDFHGETFTHRYPGAHRHVSALADCYTETSGADRQPYTCSNVHNRRRGHCEAFSNTGTLAHGHTGAYGHGTTGAHEHAGANSYPDAGARAVGHLPN